MDDPNLVTEAGNFLRFVVDYILTKNARISAHHTLSYGYWLTKFELADDGMLHIFEHNPEGTEFISGLEHTLTQPWSGGHRVPAARLAVGAGYELTSRAGLKLTRSNCCIRYYAAVDKSTRLSWVLASCFRG